MIKKVEVRDDPFTVGVVIGYDVVGTPIRKRVVDAFVKRIHVIKTVLHESLSIQKTFPTDYNGSTYTIRKRKTTYSPEREFFPPTNRRGRDFLGYTEVD